MSHIQLIVLGSVLGLLLVLPACNQGAKPASDASGSKAAAGSAPAPAEPGASPAPEEATAAPVTIDAAQAYLDDKCAKCHGENRQGTPLGPALTGIDANWDMDKLVKYMQNPADYAAKDDRLSKQAAKYPAMMPPVQADAATLKALADWLLVGG